MNKIKLIIFVLLLSLYWGNANGQFKKVAISGFSFLEIPVTARTASLGDASLALSDLNSDAVFVNPAGLGFSEKSHNLSFSYSPYLAEIKQYSSSYSINTDAGIFGIGVLMFDYGKITKTKKNGNSYDVLGEFSSNSISINLSYSKRLTDKFAFGITAKYINEKIDIYNASNLLLDVGALYYTGLGSFRIASSVQNFGPEIKYLNEPFKMPIMFRLGGAMELIGKKDDDYRLTCMVEAFHPSSGEVKLNLGTEFSWMEMIQLRAGYKFLYDEESFTFGAGVSPGNFAPVKVDLGYCIYGKLGDVIRLTIQLGLL